MTTYVCPLLVGRSEEVADLTAVIGRRGTALVLGPAGVGKSALVRQAVDGRATVTGRATPSATRRPYRPIADAALRARSDRELPPPLQQLVDPHATTDLDPLHLADALIEALPDAVLVLEDLHWADSGTLDVVEQLADRRGLAVVATARDELPVVRGAHVVRLGPLPDLDIHEVASRCLGGALTARLATTIARGADGLPLLVEELLAALSTDGRLHETPDGWDVVGAEPAVPRGVAETVAPRLARLDEAGRRLLAAAALIGRRFDWEIAAAAAGAQEALPALRRAAELQLLDADPDRPGALRFRHALTRDAVDALTFPPERAALASRAFDALLTRHPVPTGDDLHTAAALARAAGREREAAPLLVEAAIEAFDRHAFDAAAQLLDDAVAISPPDDPVHLRAQQERLRVLSQMGRLAEVTRLGERLLGMLPPADATAHIEVRLRLARAATDRLEPDSAREHVRVARCLLSAEHRRQCHPPRVELEEALAHLAAARLDDAVASARTCIALTFPEDPDRDRNSFADVEAFGLLAWARAVRRRQPQTARSLLDRADDVIAGLPFALLSARLDVERAALDLDAGIAQPPDLDAAERGARLAGGRGVVARIAVLRGVAALLRLDEDGVLAHADVAERLASRHSLPAIAREAARLRATARAMRGHRYDGDATIAAIAAVARGESPVPPDLPDSDVLLPFAALWDDRPSAAPWVEHHRARLHSTDPAALGDAAAWFEQHDLLGAAEAARDRLRKQGIPFPRRRSAQTDVPRELQARGITAREHEVLVLVTQGLSNREVAERLVLSVRTVDKHVEHLLAKTGSPNRTALARLARTYSGT